MVTPTARDRTLAYEIIRRFDIKPKPSRNGMMVGMVAAAIANERVETIASSAERARRSAMRVVGRVMDAGLIASAVRAPLRKETTAALKGAK